MPLIRRFLKLRLPSPLYLPDTYFVVTSQHDHLFILNSRTPAKNGSQNGVQNDFFAAHARRRCRASPTKTALLMHSQDLLLKCWIKILGRPKCSGSGLSRWMSTVYLNFCQKRRNQNEHQMVFIPLCVYSSFFVVFPRSAPVGVRTYVATSHATWKWYR